VLKLISPSGDKKLWTLVTRSIQAGNVEPVARIATVLARVEREWFGEDKKTLAFFPRKSDAGAARGRPISGSV